MGVHQVGDSARLDEEAMSVVNCQCGVEYLDGDLRSQVDMLAQIDVCESSTINQANNAIVANLLLCWLLRISVLLSESKLSCGKP